MTTRSPVLMGLMALALSIYGLALGGHGSPSQAQEAQGTAPQSVAPQAPFACSLHARARAGGTDLEAVLQAREALSASFALKVRGPGVSIDQSGDLTLAAGESTTLGQASVSGSADSLDATLTVTTGGKTYACPLQES